MKTCLGRVALGQQRSEEGIGIAALSSTDELLISHKTLATICSINGLICSLDHEQCVGVDWVYGIHGCQVQITCNNNDIRFDLGSVESGRKLCFTCMCPAGSSYARVRSHTCNTKYPNGCLILTGNRQTDLSPADHCLVIAIQGQPCLGSLSSPESDVASQLHMRRQLSLM